MASICNRASDWTGCPSKSTSGHSPLPLSHSEWWLAQRRRSVLRMSSGYFNRRFTMGLLRKIEPLGFLIVFDEENARFLPIVDVNEAGAADEGLQGHD